MESNQPYTYFKSTPEPHASQNRTRVRATGIQMDFSQTYMGHQMHGQQGSQYDGGQGGLGDTHHRVRPTPEGFHTGYQANLPHEGPSFHPDFQHQGANILPSWSAYPQINTSSLPLGSRPPPEGLYTDFEASLPHQRPSSYPDFQDQGANLLPSWSAWPQINTSLLPTEVRPPPDGFHTGFQPNLSHQEAGSMSSWTPYSNMNGSLPFETTGPPGSGHDQMGFDPNFQHQGVGFQPTWLPSADTVAPMPQVDYGKLREADYRMLSRKQLEEYCQERDIKTSRRTTKDEYVNLAQPVLPGVNCWALSNLELRARCKAHNVATPHNIQHDSKAVMAQNLREDDAKWGI